LVKVFSMFTGIGGFELGIRRSGIDAELIGYSEIDKYAIQIFEKHFEGVKNYGNATNIMGEQLPAFDLLVGGFPCQAFSVAGHQRGFDDTRGTLFFDIARILEDKRPRNLVLENVKGLLSHDSGKTFHTILRILSEMGYDVEWQVLNSKDFGVPQNRERVYIVGHLGGRSGRKVFPLRGEGSSITRNKVTNEWNVYAVQDTIRINKRQNGTRFRGQDEPSHTITASDRHGVLFELTKNKAQGQRIYESENGLSNTLNTSFSRSGIYKMGARIRRLTPIECNRLQGFPDDWTEGISETQQFKTIGNAVTVNVVEKVIKSLYNE
tara:strand:+ start:1104 stop:2069 length:966 start_codon:yes stop_codon:yes gene_type:complete